MASRMLTPSATPIPIPAFAPLDKPEGRGWVFGAVAVEGAALLREDMPDDEEAVGVDADVEATETTGSPNFFASVDFLTSLPALQHSVDPPQHQSIEVDVPSHGCTVMCRRVWRSVYVGI
ncbi:hypothetical protein ACN47E_008680 [Coniothyrium glycines]